MPIVRPYPESEVSPQPLPDVAPNVPAAGDIDLFGGNRARDLQLVGQNLGQASDSLFSIYQRRAQEANDTRVQDVNNQFITGVQQALRTGPDAYGKLEGADAIKGAGAVTQKLATFKDQLLEQAPNDYQRRKLAPILEAHLALAKDEIARHVGRQQQVYERRVHASAIEVAGREAISNPENLGGAVARAADATRTLHRAQPPEVVESEASRAESRVVSDLITDRLTRDDPAAVALYRQHQSRLDPGDRSALGAAVATLSNSIDAAAWLRERSATLNTPAPTGDAALDAVNAATASTAEPPPVIASNGMLLDPDGIVGTRERLDEIETRRRALTALNEQEFAANPARLRANRTAIDIDTARSRAAVKAETDALYADLRRHLTTGGPDGGPAITPPPATIMSRLTEEQQDAVSARINRAIAGIKTTTDPQTFYAIHQGLTGDDAGARARWAAKNLTPFMDRLSDEDLAALEKLQAAGGAEQRRLQAITRMANDTLRRAGIDPTPQPDASPGSDAEQAARFNRLVHDEFSAVESMGRKPIEAEAHDIVNGLKDTAIKSGWLKVSDRAASATVLSDFPSVDDAFHAPGAQLAQAGLESGTAAMPRDASLAPVGAPALGPAGSVLAEAGQAVLQGASRGAAWLGRAAPAAAGVTAAALPLMLIPTNTQAELHPIGENLRVRTAPGQRSATVQLRVEQGFFGTGISEKWIDLPVGAEWANDEQTGRRYIALDQHGLENVIGRDAADAALGNGIAMARPPKEDEEDEWGDEPRQESSKSRDRRQNRPPPAEDLEQRPDRAPSKPPHELSDEEIADIANKIARGHASRKHRHEFPEFGSEVEFEAHVAKVIQDKRSENKTTPEDHTAYWHQDSGTAVVVDPLAPDQGTVLRPRIGRRFFDNIPTKYY
jgi:hypothetical protein